jgi:hypothetical protein
MIETNFTWPTDWIDVEFKTVFMLPVPSNGTSDRSGTKSPLSNTLQLDVLQILAHSQGDPKSRNQGICNLLGVRTDVIVIWAQIEPRKLCAFNYKSQNEMGCTSNQNRFKETRYLKTTRR